MSKSNTNKEGGVKETNGSIGPLSDETGDNATLRKPDVY